MRRADGGRRIVRFGGFTLIWLVGSMLLPASTAGQTAASTDGARPERVPLYLLHPVGFRGRRGVARTVGRPGDFVR